MPPLPLFPDRDQGPTDERVPFEEGSGYYKTRVERVFSRRLGVPVGVSTYRLWFTHAQTQRSNLVDAPVGLAFAELVPDGGQEGLSGVTLQLLPIWEIPDSVEVVKPYSSSTLPPGTPLRVLVWEGAIPGRAGIDLTFTNTGTGTAARLTIDLCAKRPGATFMPGHRLLDASNAKSIDRRLPDYDEDPEGPSPPRPGSNQQCRPRGTTGGHRDAERGAPTAKVAAGKSISQDDGDVEGGQTGNAVEYTPSVIEGVTPVPCEPDASAVDWNAVVDDIYWRSFVGATANGSQMPDPEVMAAAATFSGGNLVLDPITESTHKMFGVSIDLARDLPSLVGPIASSGLGPWLGRCPGFSERWTAITGGIESNRMPSRTLVDILRREHEPEGGLLDWIEADDPEDTAWNWRFPAPWFFAPAGTARLEERCTWFVVSVLNLVHATFDLGQNGVDSPRLGGKFNVIGKARNRWRVEELNPYWRLKVRGLSEGGGSLAAHFAHADLGAFDATTLEFPVPSLAASQFFDGTSTERGRSLPWPIPIPSWVRLRPRLVVPQLRAAQECYAIARVLAMVASQHPGIMKTTPWPTQRLGAGHMAWDVLDEFARIYYRAHLTALFPAAKTLMHELFHLLGRQPEDQYLYLLSLGKTTHCHTGCGQEKIATSWLQAVAEELGAGWFQPDRMGEYPLTVELAGTTRPHVNASGASICRGPKKVGVQIAWQIDNMGESGKSKLTWAADFPTLGPLLDARRAKCDKSRDRQQLDLEVQLLRLDTRRERAEIAGRANAAARLARRMAEIEARRSKKIAKKFANCRARAARWFLHQRRSFARACWDDTKGSPRNCAVGTSCG